MKVRLESDIVNDKFTEYLYESYDIQDREKTVTEVPIPSKEDIDTIDDDEEFNILLVCGRSGSGKSTILRNILNNGLPTIGYDEDKCVISQFPTLSEEEACDLLCGVGLSSVPTWLRRPSQLSNGERARLDICKAIYDAKVNGNEFVVSDEFTSVVNRDAAKSMSFALQRYARKNGLRLVVASCHFDVVDWLQPDYVFNLNHMDENGDVEMEHMVYDGEDKYNSQQTIEEADALTEALAI